MLIRFLVTALFARGAVSASAQTFPNRAIHIVVAYAPGGTGDIVARLISVPLGEALGQSVVIENRAGGTALGALNAAGWVTHQNLPLPLLFVCEDNGLGVSVRSPPGRLVRVQARQTTWR